MNYCPNCGNELEENSNFCPKCGYSLIDSKEGESVVAGDSANTNIPKSKKMVEEYKSNILLPVFFFGFLFTALFINWTLGLLIIIISWFVLYSDAQNIGAGKHCEKEKTSPMTWNSFSWLLFTVFFWIISYPYYMIKRKEIWEINLGY